MKKMMMATAVLSLLPLTVACASPLAKIAPGAAKVDANVTVGNTLKWKQHGETKDFGGDSRYRVAHEGDHDASAQSHQVSLIYQFNPYLYGYGGYVRNRLKQHGYHDNNSGYQVGAIGRLPITDKTTGWAKFGTGNNITQYELGVGYAFTDNWEANVSYNDSKYKDFKGDIDAKTHEVNVGVSYKF